MKTSRVDSASGTELLAIVCLAAGWWAIWFLWPEPRATPASAGRPAASGTRYVFRFPEENNSPWSPVLIALPSRDGFSGALMDEITEEGESFRPVNVDAAIFLSRSAFPKPVTAAAPEDDLAARMSDSIGRYRPSPWETPVFDRRPGDSENEVMIEYSGALKERRFEVAVPSTNDVLRTEKPWIVKAYVEVDEEGKVSHAFFEDLSEYGTINTAVVRAVYQGRLAQPGEACEGVVTVSWPGKAVPAPKR